MANHPWSIDDLAEDGGELCRRRLHRGGKIYEDDPAAAEATAGAP